MERAASSIIPRAVTHLGSPTETSCCSSAGLPRLSKMLGSAPPSRSVEHPTRGRDRRRALGRSGRPRPARSHRLRVRFQASTILRRNPPSSSQLPKGHLPKPGIRGSTGIYSLALSGRQGPSVWRTIEANQLQLFQFSPHPFQTLIGRLCG